ncbi:MAG: WhiB family transcriptional regulator [Microthrixaceae bacterium]
MGLGWSWRGQVCATCPVKTQCLEYALANRIDHGVWGGTSERERRRILKRRSAERRAAAQAVS